VVGCARDAERLAELAEEEPALSLVAADVTSSADRHRLVEHVLARHGRIDVLVNNAGQGWAGLVEEMPEEDLQRVVAVNLVAVMDLTRRALPHLLRQGDGDVVMVSSAATWLSIPPLTVYSATKSGVDGFVRALRREVTARGVRVHSVNPGPVRTEWLARSLGRHPGEVEGPALESPGVPPEWVADAVQRCLTRGWARTESVPRLAGLGRLLELPPVDRLLDHLMSRNAGRVAAEAHEQVEVRQPAR
jgi:NAD(P)-dependent dehydrogenase (short-subunit alcohol dehydrogenase family)